eukprot:CAMPEP_0183721578 /NCGR_PEP_ID=MMETSP0737-20130205/13813_1 /TAXON_ID=385413 /ORGANISM="Thalassiosira miniscula, Strain CCMP1093" /LENGTH=74 /DNA_ID=CAMNT_0025951615 /DNA_START=145 /DNA_END=366 /DNA_ORIENTATION=+
MLLSTSDPELPAGEEGTEEGGCKRDLPLLDGFLLLRLGMSESKKVCRRVVLVTIGGATGVLEWSAVAWCESCAS